MTDDIHEFDDPEGDPVTDDPEDDDPVLDPEAEPEEGAGG